MENKNTTEKQLSGEEKLKLVGLPYINDYMVGVFESIAAAQERVPAGWRVIYTKHNAPQPENSIRIGQVKVRHSDADYPLYVVLA